MKEKYNTKEFLIERDSLKNLNAKNIEILKASNPEHIKPEKFIQKGSKKHGYPRGGCFFTDWFRYPGRERSYSETNFIPYIVDLLAS